MLERRLHAANFRALPVLFILSLALSMVGCGCGDDDDSDDGISDDDVDDDADDDVNDDADDDSDNDFQIDESPKWITDRDYLQNRSLWRQDIDMSEAPIKRKLGCVGVGNGRVFGILGNQYPQGGWHNLGGPTYQKDLKWFTDKRPWLIAQGQAVEPKFTSISRVRNTPIAIVESEGRGMEWTSVNFAPKYESDPLVEQALISVWIVRNVSANSIHNVILEMQSIFGNYNHDNGIFTESDFDSRLLHSKPLSAAMDVGINHQDFRLHLGHLKSGEEKIIVLPLVFTEEGEDHEQIFTAIETAGVDALLESTRDWWNEWASQIAVFETPDEKFNDLMRAQAMAIKISQATTGGVGEMSQYSNSWLRDVHGPSLYYPLIGLGDDFKDMIDYLWGVSVLRGGISNANEIDVDISDLPAQPDWESMGVMGGRTGAESPSTLVLEYENYYKATGDLAVIEERYGMLKHAVKKLKYVDGCLLHFSTDETFEDVMEAAFGENVLEEPDESTLSFYSSLLALRAARFTAEMAEALGYTDDADELGTLADNIETCAQETFWMEDEGYYAVKAQTDTREPFHQPYEDVSTMPLWLDAFSVDDPRVVGNFERMWEILGHENGTLYSPLGEPYATVFTFVKEGVQTGMSHGYWLSNPDKMFHPIADEAFSRWEQWFTRTGFTEEAVVVDDYGHLAILAEPFGIACDISARFRSWESGIMGFAYLYHLTGYDRSVPGGWVKLAPHLPPEWDEFAVRGLEYGEGRLDIEVARNASGGRTIAIITDESATFDLTLTVPLDGTVSTVALNGETLPPEGFTALENAYGRTVVRLEPFAVAADGENVVEILLQ